MDQTVAFAQARGVDLRAVANAQGGQRLGLIEAAVEALLMPEADKQAFRQHANRVARLFKAILPDTAATALAPLSLALAVASVAGSLHALTDPPDISDVMNDVEALLNDSIATEGYHIAPAKALEGLVNLSDIDFEALQKAFDSGRKRTEAEKLKRLIEGKLAAMLQLNASRVDLAEKFQKLIDEYNAGSRNTEGFFEGLKDFVRVLSSEDRRAIAEELSEEELALFDILIKPEPALNKKEEAEVKKVCRKLLSTLKRKKLVLDWREKQQARAAVMQTLKAQFRRLPEPFTRDMREEKRARAYAHVYDHYFGAGASSYSG